MVIPLHQAVLQLFGLEPMEVQRHRRRPSRKVKPRSLTETIESIFIHMEDCDFNLNFNGVKYPVHRFIIDLRSTLLQNVGKDETEAFFNIPQKDFPVFTQFIKFLYFDQCIMKDLTVAKLFEYSCEYEVPLLKQKCIQYISTGHLLYNNCFLYAELAFKYDCAELLHRCYATMTQHLTHFNFCYHDETLFYYPISKELLIEVLKNLPREHSYEDTIMTKVFIWVEKETIRRDVPTDNDNVRKILLEIIPYVRVENLTAPFLSDFICEWDLLPRKDIVKLFQKLSDTNRWTSLSK